MNKKVNLKILLLGAAGAGKGTQAARLAEELRLPHISTGDLIRGEIKSGSELGNKVKAIVEAGQLVSDDIVNEIVKSKMASLDGCILDGYPRTLEQAKFFDSYAKFDSVFNFEVAKGELVERLTGRRMCSKTNDPSCKGAFHVKFNPPQAEGKCDLCGSDLMIRKDDQPEVIEKRLSGYEAETGKPLTEFYTAQGNFTNINGEQNPDQVFEELKSHLQKFLQTT